MIKLQCNHKWIHRDEFGMETATFKCENCHIEMSVADVLQLEALENQTKLARYQLGFQKWLSLAAVIISVASLVISVFVALYK